MTIVNRLLSAETDTEFFILVSALATNHDNIHAELKTTFEHPTLILSVALPTRTHLKDRVLLHWQTVHVFKLDGRGTLTWQLSDGQALTGLQQIHAFLRANKSADALFELPARAD